MQDGSITVPSEIFLWRKNTARWLIFKSSHIPLHLAQDAENQVLHVAVSQFSPSVMSDSLQPHWLQHTRPLSITNSQRLPKLMSIESMIESNHLFLCHPLLFPPSIFPSIRVFLNESVLCIRRPKYWVSSSASVLPMNIQDWFPLGWTGWISLQSKGLSRVFSNTTVQKHQLLDAQLS